MKLAALALGLALYVATPQPVTGEATFYGSGVMEQVYAYRVKAGDVQPCPECVDMVALLHPDTIGRKVWLEHPDGSVVGPLLVIDCARKQDVAALVRRKWVVDVSWRLGHYWAMRGPLDGVTVHFAPPPVRRLLRDQPHTLPRKPTVWCVTGVCRA